MKVFLVLCLAAAVSAQKLAILKKLLKEESLCGSGNRPTSCTCPNGNTFTSGSRDKSAEGPCGNCLLPTSCTCKDDTTVQVPSRAELKQKLKDKVLNKSNNPCGAGVSPTCTCSDGTTVTPGEQEAVCGSPPSSPCPSGGLPASCSCPDGTDINVRRLRKAFRDLLAI